MYLPLTPCPGCSRHVRNTEATCPFCKSALPEMPKAALPLAPRGVSRAAALAFGATLAVTACSGKTTTTSDTKDAAADGPDDNGGPVAEYGAPAIDSGGGQALYGAPAIDSGPDDGGGGVPKYGAPPIDGG